MNGSMRFALTGLIALVIAASPAVAAAESTIAGTIELPGGEPLAVGVYEKGDKVFVSDDNSGDLLILDGSSHAVLDRVAVGGSALDIAVNETYGKVYVGSDKGFSTGLTTGTGMISVVDADTNALLSQFTPAGQGNFSAFAFASDEVRDRVYVGYYGGTGVIEAASDAWTPIAGAPSLPDALAVNTVTDEVHVIKFNTASLTTIQGSDLSVASAAFPDGVSGPLDLAVNEVENKVYVTMLHVPGQGEISILIRDLDTGSAKFVGADDLEPLVFNQASNTLFSGVQVGAQGAIVDGATDAFLPLGLGDSGFIAAAVRAQTDNAYFASPDSTVVVSNAFDCARRFETAPGAAGGLIAGDVGVNEATGRVYVINRHTAGKVTVFQDSGPGCTPTAPPAPTPTPTPTPAPDTSIVLRVDARASQKPLRQRAVVAYARCPQESCTVRAAGYVRVSGRRVRLVPASRSLPAATRGRLSLRLSSKALRSVRRALGRGTRLTARLSIRATDAAGNVAGRSLSVRLRRR